MKLVLIIVVAALVAGAVSLIGCSEEAQGRVSNAVGALRGDNQPQGERLPKIVSEQQKREQLRQDTQWTPENQALHPKEYCQAQLEQLRAYADTLEVAAHKIAMARSKATRLIENKQGEQRQAAEFLATAKQAYRAADAANAFPVTLGGFKVSKEVAQRRIVEAAAKGPTLAKEILQLQNQRVLLEKKAERISREQERLVKIREKVQATLENLSIKEVIEGEESITNALNAINESMASLGEDFNEPELKDMMQPSTVETIYESFEAIMAE
ncbi:MAG: hypothetical protein ACI4QJ_00035 [Candidatus Spyradenecus sp.]